MDNLLHQISQLIAQRRYTDAIPLAQKAIEADPKNAEAHMKLGIATCLSGHAPQAIPHYRKALELNPDFALCYHELAYALNTIGLLPEAIDAFQRAFALNPRLPNLGSNLLMNLNYIDSITPEQLFQEHLKVAAVFPKPNPPPRNPPRQRIRIGYYSPDLNAHPVAFFVSPLFSHADRTRFEIIVYSDCLTPDVMTQRLRSHGHAWRDVSRASDAQLESCIRNDQLDILIDLAGHMARNRMLVLATKPAPILVHYLGYSNTCALPAFDYRLTDAHADPPGQTEKYHTEKLTRLPDTFLSYAMPRGLPDPPPPPCLTRNHITFGCYNNFLKISPTLINLWSQILAQVPNSRLQIKSSYFPDPSARDTLLSRFNNAGIDLSRVTFLNQENALIDHLRRYFELDIALDTYPHNGITTTCEALQMGIPVITLAGPTHVTRCGLSILTNLALPNLIATTPDQYVQRAVALANNPTRISELRHSLRSRMLSSKLCDNPTFVRHLEAAYIQMMTAPL